ncbi:putative Methylation [Sterolibacterium denitrificans]|uniref:Type II secretion system protein H n=1 Tax=Sterolibacterium denitrificans TaxID=157592 RepID=A0A7Z7HQF7_9PROT|nr:GspH/FimT family protein [Sterolibacterium denitrificans]SMB24118.1 putative Methylation [Sterolibacterium denitrificans]
MTRQRGFTMIELIVVLIVIGIVAVVAVVRFAMLDSFSEVAYSNEIKSVLSYARKVSVARRRHVCVTFDAQSAAQLRAEVSAPENHAGNCSGYPALSTPSGASGLVPPRDVTISSPALPFSVEFNSDGRPVAAQTIVLTNGNTAATATITLEQESGYAH